MEKVSTTFPFIKATCMLAQVGMETLVLKKQVFDGIPRMNELASSNATNITEIVWSEADEAHLHERYILSANVPVTPEMHATFVRSAVFYTIFYLLGVLCSVTYWAKFCKAKKKKRHFVPVAGTLILIFCDMPLMVSEMYMLIARGQISVADDLFDLILQIVYCFNGLIHIAMDLFLTNFDKKKDCFGTLITIVVSFILMNCLYTPIVWVIAGWYWIGIYSITDLESPIVIGYAKGFLNTLIVLGHFGQVVMISAGVLIFVCYTADAYEDYYKKPEEPVEEFPPQKKISETILPKKDPNLFDIEEEPDS